MPQNRVVEADVLLADESDHGSAAIPDDPISVLEALAAESTKEKEEVVKLL